MNKFYGSKLNHHRPKQKILKPKCLIFVGIICKFKSYRGVTTYLYDLLDSDNYMNSF